MKHQYKKHIKVLAAFIFCWANFLSLAQDQGDPFVKNYLSKDYGQHAQNWAITQDARGILYFSNGNGVLTYDGGDWRIIQLPKQTTARSLAMGSDSTIYVGGSIDIGYLAPSPTGKMAYQSLGALLPDSISQHITNVWATHAIGDDIFFRTYYRIFRYNVVSKKLTHWSFPRSNRTYFSFEIEGALYVETKKGLIVLRNDAFEDADGHEQIDSFGGTISLKLPYKKDTVILSGRRGNLFKYPLSPNREEEESTLFKNINAALAKYTVYHDAIRLSNGYYAIGSMGNGLLVFNNDFELVNVINKENNRLENTTIYYSFADRDGATWLGGATGLSRVDLTASLSNWHDALGIVGNGYDAVRSRDGEFYASTSEATFFYEQNRFHLVKGTEATQSWHMHPFTNPEDPNDHRLIAGIGSAFMEIEGKQAKQVRYMDDAVFKLYTDPLDSSRVLISTGDGGIAYAQMKRGKWVFFSPMPGTSDNNRSISVDKATGDIWVGTFRNGVMRIKREMAYSERTKAKDSVVVKEVIRYGEEEGVLSNKNVIIFEVAGRRIFGTDKGLCEYNPKSDRFEPSMILGEQYSNGSRDVFSMLEAPNGDIWFSGLFVNSSPAGVAHLQADGSYKLNFRPFQKVPPMMALALHVEESGEVWLGGSEGFFQYKPEKALETGSENFYALIRRIDVGADSTLFYGNTVEESTASQKNSEEILTISPQFNRVSMHFAAPFFDNEDQTTFSFQLEGFDSDWSPWENITKKEYTNLSPDTYTFKVKAKNLYGEESQISSYTFKILPPWYKHPVAYFMYALASVLLIWVIVRFNSQRLKRENEKLEAIIAERTKEVRNKNTELEQQKEEILAQSQVLKNANEQISKQKDDLSLKAVELSQQKEEILAQTENLRDLNDQMAIVNQDLNMQQQQLQKAYGNIQVLSGIGKEITAHLDLSGVISTIYSRVNSLMDASGFGVGVYHPTAKQIVFSGYIEKGEALEDHADPISNPKLISVRVFQSKEPVISNDLERDMTELFEGAEVTQGDIPLSMMYLPLIYRGQAIGVITVQSFQKDAYTENDITLFENLASYASIAVANATNYQLVQAKNKHITDSIRYSKTIQAAFLPNQEQLNETVGEHFLIYRPKDIVSGDFYWTAHVDNYTFVAVVDCTGHGVPGSFMSIVGATLFKEIIVQKRIADPATILETLDQELIKTLHQEDQANDDGMDLILIRAERKGGGREIAFAGAKNDLYFIRAAEEKLQTLQGTRRHIGGTLKKHKSFTTQVVNFRTGDRLYLGSDGMSDQSSPDYKKLGSRKVKQLIQESFHLSMPEQQQYIEQALDDFAQNMPQRDDITLMGLEIE